MYLGKLSKNTKSVLIIEQPIQALGFTGIIGVGKEHELYNILLTASIENSRNGKIFLFNQMRLDLMLYENAKDAGVQKITKSISEKPGEIIVMLELAKDNALPLDGNTKLIIEYDNKSTYLDLDVYGIEAPKVDNLANYFTDVLVQESGKVIDIQEYDNILIKKSEIDKLELNYNGKSCVFSIDELDIIAATTNESVVNNGGLIISGEEQDYHIIGVQSADNVKVYPKASTASTKVYLSRIGKINPHAGIIKTGGR